MIAIFSGVFRDLNLIDFRALSTSFVSFFRSISVRPHVGQEIMIGSFVYRPRVLRSSFAALTSLIGESVREIRIVSPMPLRSKVPRARALFVIPGINVPASVTPRWIGYAVLVWRSSFALIVVSTSGLLIEITRFLNLFTSKNLIHFSVRVTSEYGVGALLNEPEFIPMRIGILCFFASLIMSLSLSLSFMFSGLIRILSAPARIASSARL